MNVNQTSQAGKPCLALRKAIGLKSVVIAGGAALFVGLVGNVQAIPITMHDDLDAGMRSWTLKHDQGNSEAAHSFDQSGRNQSLASPTAFSLFSLVPAQRVGEPPNFGSLNSYNHRHGVPKTQPFATVPDGGSTGLMMGGVFCGLALLARRLKL